MINLSKQQWTQLKQTDTKRFYKNNLQGRKITNPVLGDIKFTQLGLGETIHRVKRKYHPFICLLREIIETGSCDCKLEPLYKPRKDRIVGFYHIKNQIKLRHILIGVDVLIAQDQDGNKYYMFKKGSQGDLGEGLTSQRGPSEPNNIITDVDTFVKGERYAIGDCLIVTVLAENIKLTEQLVYHGTNSTFKTFSKTQIGKNTEVVSDGFFFTDSIDTAKTYGKNILKCDIDLGAYIVCDFDGKATYYFGEEKWYTPNELAKRIMEFNKDVANYCYSIGNMDREEAEEYMDTLGGDKGYYHLSDNQVDSIICKNVKDNLEFGGETCTNYIVFDENRIRILEQLQEDKQITVYHGGKTKDTSDGLFYYALDPKYVKAFHPRAKISKEVINLPNLFDYRNPKHLEQLMSKLADKIVIEDLYRGHKWEIAKSDLKEKLNDTQILGNYYILEDKNIQKIIKTLGFKGFYMTEVSLSGKLYTNIALFSLPKTMSESKTKTQIIAYYGSQIDNIKRQGYDDVIFDKEYTDCITYCMPIDAQKQCVVIKAESVDNHDVEENKMNEAGYDWNRGMSNNAVSAYANGEKPLSKWNKTEILSGIEQMDISSYDKSNGITESTKQKLLEIFKKLPLIKLKKLLEKASYHHTGKYFNATDFYKLPDFFIDIIDAAERNDLIAETDSLYESQSEYIRLRETLERYIDKL